MSSLQLKNMASSDYRRLDTEEEARPINQHQQNIFKRDKSSPNKKVSKFPIFGRNDSMEEINSPVRGKDLNSSYCEPVDRSEAREIDLINEQ